MQLMVLKTVQKEVRVELRAYEEKSKARFVLKEKEKNYVVEDLVLLRCICIFGQICKIDANKQGSIVDNCSSETGSEAD
uniref:Uncharacterized protein n=1 Tax=Romanomermis culicivorax TaxID=13658 RepID=A0A915JM40_ROMCU